MEASKNLKEKMNEIRQVKDSFFESTECCPNLFSKIGEMVKNNPNDSDLGKTIRNFYLDLKK